MTDENGTVIRIVGIRCSLCKRKISQSVSEEATKEDLDRITDAIHFTHMEWHRKRREKGKE